MGRGKVVCISGIDTDIGKTIAVGLLAKFLLAEGVTVITQKICQTGCLEVSEDIRMHRKIMGIDLQQVDRDGLTCPYIFAEPCSPHLAARLQDKKINLHRITAATRKLQSSYDYVILEGVGGLMVPLTPETLLVDYLATQDYDHILVSCSRLGSINHTLSALEIIRQRNIHFSGIIYNRYMDSNKNIAEDSRRCFLHFLEKWGLAEVIVDLPVINDPKESTELPDFSDLL